MRRFLNRPRVRVVLEAVAVIAAFYLVPVRADRELGVRIALTLVILGIVGVLVTRHVRRDSDPLSRLFVVLLLAIASLALAFYAASAVPGQFTGLETRTDALYFTVVTMATIGYGDVHPTGQLARTLVTIGVVFQFVFLTALISTIARRLRGREADDDD